MTVSMLRIRLVLVASLALSAAVGGGWKWERLPVPFA